MRLRTHGNLCEKTNKQINRKRFKSILSIFLSTDNPLCDNAVALLAHVKYLAKMRMTTIQASPPASFSSCWQLLGNRTLLLHLRLPASPIQRRRHGCTARASCQKPLITISDIDDWFVTHSQSPEASC